MIMLRSDVLLNVINVPISRKMFTIKVYNAISDSMENCKIIALNLV